MERRQVRLNGCGFAQWGGRAKAMGWGFLLKCSPRPHFKPGGAALLLHLALGRGGSQNSGRGLAAC